MDGKVKLKIDTNEGILPGRMRYSSSPCNVATTSDGHFYITDHNPWVKIHDKNGRFVRLLQLVGNDGLACNSGKASGIVIDDDGRIIVGEEVRKTISIYKSDTTFVTAFKVDLSPCYIATAKSDGRNILLVNDTRGTRNTLALDYSGKVLERIRSPLSGVFWNPRGICYSKVGEIFVTNGKMGQGCVCRYTSSWQYTGCVISDLKEPYGIAISDDGELLAIVDAWSKLKIFRRIRGF